MLAISIQLASALGNARNDMVEGMELNTRLALGFVPAGANKMFFTERQLEFALQHCSFLVPVQLVRPRKPDVWRCSK